MTQSVELVTLKGESEKDYGTRFLFNKNIGVTYQPCTENSQQVEIQLSHLDVAEEETFQMIFVIKGNMQIAKSGSTHIYSNICTHQHNLFRLPIKEISLITNPADDVICINLSPSFLNSFLPKDHVAYQQLYGKNVNGIPLVLSVNNMQISPEISAILQKLSNSTQNAFSDQLLLESKVIELFALQMVQFEQMQNNEGTAMLKKSEIERMHDAREILINQSGDRLTLRALAHLVGTNEFNLKRDFKLLFGNTVFAYLNQYKMEKAKSLLNEEDITIAEISKKIGYKHATHFTNAFKKYFGYLPNKIKRAKFSVLIFLEDFLIIFEDAIFLIV